MAQPQKPWTPEDIAALARMRSDGLPVKQIARRLGRTRAAIVNRVRRVKAPKLFRRDEYLRMFGAGLSNLEVAERMGVAPSTVGVQRCELRRAGHHIPHLKRGPKPK